MSFSFCEEEGYHKHMGNTEQLKCFGRRSSEEDFMPWFGCYLAQRRGALSPSGQWHSQPCLQPSAGGARTL